MADGLREMIAYDGEASEIQAYLARPATEGSRPAVIVIHEILGLTDHIKGIANRFVEEGYVAFAPNLFSRPGLAEVLTPSNVEEVMRFLMTMPTGRMPSATSPQGPSPGYFVKIHQHTSGDVYSVPDRQL